MVDTRTVAPPTDQRGRGPHGVELVAGAHDQPGGGDRAIGAVRAGDAGMLLDAVGRNFRRAPKDGEDRAVAQEVDGIITPFTGRDLAAIEAKNAVELAA